MKSDVLKSPRAIALMLSYIFATSGYALTASFASILGVNSTLLTIPFRGIVLATAAFIVGAYILRMPFGKNSVAIVTLAFAIFWGLYIFRLMLDIGFELNPVVKDPNEYLLYSLGITFFPMLAFIADVKPECVRNTGYGVILGLALATIFSLILAYLSLGSGTTNSYNVGRFSTDYLNPISLGHLGVSLALVAAHYLVFDRATTFTKLFLLLLIVLGALACVASASKGPILAFFSAMLFFLFVVKGGRVKVVGFGLLLTLTGLAIAAMNWTRENLGLTIDRVLSAADFGADLTTQGRLERMSEAFTQFSEHPIIGSSIEVTGIGDYPHNVILEAFMSTGVFGGLAFLVIIVSSVMKSRGLLISFANYGWLSLLCIQYIVAAQVSGAIYSSATMWCMIVAVHANWFARIRKLETMSFT